MVWGIQVNGEKRGTSSNGKRETLLIDINKPHAWPGTGNGGRPECVAVRFDGRMTGCDSLL